MLLKRIGSYQYSLKIDLLGLMFFHLHPLDKEWGKEGA